MSDYSLKYVPGAQRDIFSFIDGFTGIPVVHGDV